VANYGRVLLTGSIMRFKRWGRRDLNLSDYAGIGRKLLAIWFLIIIRSIKNRYRGVVRKNVFISWYLVIPLSILCFMQIGKDLKSGELKTRIGYRTSEHAPITYWISIFFESLVGLSSLQGLYVL
jgi:hypothetical protein